MLSSLLIILSFTLVIQQANAAILSAWGTPTLDGVVNPSEWASAETISFGPTIVGSQTITITFYIMNDATNLYMAAIVSGDDDFNGFDDMRLYFDNDNGGEGNFEAGDDAVWSFGAGGALWDLFYTGTYLTYDFTDPPGGTDGVGKGSRQGSDNHFEVSHPLNSGDTGHDFALSIGQIIGFMVEFRVDATYIRRSGEFYDNPSSYIDDYQIASEPAQPPPTPPHVPPSSVAVGGIILPTSKLSIISPYVVLTALVSLALIVLKKRA